MVKQRGSHNGETHAVLPEEMQAYGTCSEAQK
jgi:hypothetical protein